MLDVLRRLATDGLLLGSPGIVIAASNSGGRAAATVAAGVTSLKTGAPMLTGQRFAIGSISKTLVAVVIHQLVSEGRLDLRDSCGDYLGDEIIGSIANAAGATLESMLNHTSGIPTWEFDADWIRRGRGERFEPGNPFGKLDTLAYIRNRHPATNPVGAAYAYSNSNHTLLGLIIEKVTGSAFTDAIRTRITWPLGLGSFALESFEPIPEGAMAAGHHLASPFFRATAGVHPAFPENGPDIIDTSRADLSPEWAAGGFVATMSDLAAYGRALATDAFGPNVGTAMRAFRTFPGMTEDPKPRRVGLGLFEFDTPAGPVAAHFGGVLGYCAALILPLEEQGPVLAAGFNLGRMHTAATDEHGVWQRWLLDEAYPALSG